MNKQLLILAAAAASVALAQQTKRTQAPAEVGYFAIGAGEPQATLSSVATASGDHVVIMSAPGPLPAIERVGLSAVKGAPYSAEAVTESVQTLADGNRITSKQSTKQYRDSEGRTRTETTLTPNARWVPESKNMTFVNIMDPVSGESYTLNSGDKVATKMTLPKLESVANTKALKRSRDEAYTVHFEAAGEAGVVGAMTTAGAGEGPAVMTFDRKLMGAPEADEMAKNVKTEELGKQVIEGVECIGVRTTVTIPAGQIGNERPLEMVTERWGSPDLGVDVLRKHTDPRNGETTYRLTNLVRGEQPRSLFEVPADYKVNDFSAETMRKKMTIKMREAQPENQ